MQISMLVDELPENAFIEADNGNKVQVEGYMCSWHRADDGIDIALEKAEAFDNIVSFLKDDYNFDNLMSYDDINECIDNIGE